MLPGVLLPSGTYIFELADTTSRDVVRVSSRDRSLVYLTAFTRIVDRPAGLRQDLVVSLGEVPPGAPPPVKVWYLNNGSGREFIYDK